MRGVPEDAPPGGEDLSLLDHLLELRRRLLIALSALAVGFCACFAFADVIFALLITPYQQAGLYAGAEGRMELIYTAPQEFFFTQLKLALFGGFVIAFPAIIWQAYAFAAPGLYRQEKRALLPFLLAAPLLFALGAALVYFIVLPVILHFFLSMQQQALGYEIIMLPKVSEYLSLSLALFTGFGLAFQLPVFILLLVRAGMLDVAALRRARKYVIIAILLAAAFLTPPDVISQILLALPTILLYELSILAAAFTAPAEINSPEPAP